MRTKKKKKFKVIIIVLTEYILTSQEPKLHEFQFSDFHDEVKNISRRFIHLFD